MSGLSEREIPELQDLNPITCRDLIDLNQPHPEIYRHFDLDSEGNNFQVAFMSMEGYILERWRKNWSLER